MPTIARMMPMKWVNPFIGSRKVFLKVIVNPVGGKKKVAEAKEATVVRKAKEATEAVEETTEAAEETTAADATPTEES